MDGNISLPCEADNFSMKESQFPAGCKCTFDGMFHLDTNLLYNRLCSYYNDIIEKRNKNVSKVILAIYAENFRFDKEDFLGCLITATKTSDVVDYVLVQVNGGIIVWDMKKKEEADFKTIFH
jgi:hypothetical protein